MRIFRPTERQRWALTPANYNPQGHVGLPALDAASRALYETGLPRGVLTPRFTPDRAPINLFMAANELLQYAFLPGQIILGKFGNRFLGHLDDRPLVTIAGARSGKTSTILEPNLYLYPGSMLVLDPKGELARAALLRRALGHDVYILDPFGTSGEKTANYNVLDELDPTDWTIIDDVRTISQALVFDDGDAKSKHWTDTARTLVLGIILLTLTFPPHERNFVTVRQLLSLTYPKLAHAVRVAAEAAKAASEDGKLNKEYFDENRVAVRTLLRIMSEAGNRFGGVLAAIGNRFLGTPMTERGSIFSTASTNTDFLDSLPIRAMSARSDFSLKALRADRPVTIVLSLPVGRMESHYRWLRLIVQMACTILERMGTYPRERTPILFMMEEFATLGHMDIMERAAAYFPGFGVKLWAVLQDAGQLRRNYKNGWETFLGNAGLIQCFANGDQDTLGYVARRLEKLMEPFELRTVFARKRFTQLLMFEGEPPAAALRLGHEDVASIRQRLEQQMPQRPAALPRGLLPAGRIELTRAEP